MTSLTQTLQEFLIYYIQVTVSLKKTEQSFGNQHSESSCKKCTIINIKAFKVWINWVLTDQIQLNKCISYGGLFKINAAIPY